MTVVCQRFRRSRVFALWAALLMLLLSACSVLPESLGSSADEDRAVSEIASNGLSSVSEPDEEESAGQEPQRESQESSDNQNSEEETDMKLCLQIGDSTFTASLEDNAAADAFAEMLKQAPVTIQMSDYAGFEKVGSLGTSLPASDSQTTTHAGDIVLYTSSQIVIFYGSNSWSYTRLGKIDDLSGWEEALGSGDVTVTFSIGG